MPGKAHIPDLVERLLRGQRAGTSRTAGGFARGASPQMTRDRIGASLHSGGLLGTTARSSRIDQFEITDDSQSSFTLSRTPISQSWNVSLSWSLEDDADYGIVGRTLTVVDPTELFRGIADNGPRILQVQYDYLTGTPELPSGDISYVGSLTSLTTSANFDFVLPSGVLAGDLMVAMYTAHFSWLIDSSWATWHYAEPGSTQALAAKYITTEGPGDPVFPSIGGSAFRSSGVMGIVRGVDPVTPYHDLQFGGSPVAPSTDASRYAMHFASGYNTSDPAPLSRGTQRNAGFVTPIGAVVADETLAAGSYSVSSPGSAVAMASVVFNTVAP